MGRPFSSAEISISKFRPNVWGLGLRTQYLEIAVSVQLFILDIRLPVRESAPNRQPTCHFLLVGRHLSPDLQILITPFLFMNILASDL
jgi:hypothetical protein